MPRIFNEIGQLDEVNYIEWGRINYSFGRSLNFCLYFLVNILFSTIFIIQSNSILGNLPLDKTPVFSKSALTSQNQILLNCNQVPKQNVLVAIYL